MGSSGRIGASECIPMRCTKMISCRVCRRLTIIGGIKRRMRMRTTENSLWRRISASVMNASFMTVTKIRIRVSRHRVADAEVKTQSAMAVDEPEVAVQSEQGVKASEETPREAVVVVEEAKDDNAQAADNVQESKAEPAAE